MRRFFLILLACFAATTVAAGPTGTPRGEFTASRYSISYDPSRACTKPWRSLVERKYEEIDRQYEDASYLACLERVADADLKMVQELVQAGYDKAVKDFRRGY